MDCATGVLRPLASQNGRHPEGKKGDAAEQFHYLNGAACQVSALKGRKMENQIPSQKTFLSLEEAAQLLGTESLSVHDAEVSLIHAIEHGMLAANIKRWSTEQWDDKQLPGNINARETRIERADLEAWQKGNTVA